MLATIAGILGMTAMLQAVEASPSPSPAPSPSASVSPSSSESGLPSNDYDVPPKIVKPTTPVYPPNSFLAGIEGTVEIEFVIDVAGRVSRLRVVKSVPGLDDAALTCVKKWRFIPAKKAGRPVEVVASAPVTFRLTDKKR